MNASDHTLQFYETDEFLVDSLTRFIQAALEAGEACVVIATKAHRDALDARVDLGQLDVAAAQICDAYICLDAEETMARFMVDGMPQAGQFAEVAGGIIMRAAMGGRHVRVFGEMVAVLWAEGNHAAALGLEGLWNELHNAVHSFSLCCAYTMDSFAEEGYEDHFFRICDQHSRVIPTESYCALADSDERLRTISHLQQKAHMLEIQIAERRAAEMRLHASENRYRRLFESSTDGILLVDPDSHTIIDANPVMADLLGCTHEQLIGRELWRIGLFADQSGALDVLGKLEQNHFFRHEALPLHSQDGQRRYVEFVSNRFLANGHDVIQCNLRDITDRKHLEQEIVAQAGQLAATFEALTDGLLVFDTAGRLIQMNRAARALLMLDTDTSPYSLPAEGISRFDVRDEHNRPLSVEEWPITRVLKGEVLAGAGAVDIIIHALDGREHQLSITGAPARGEHAQIIGGVCIMHDVTERRRLEQQTRRVLAALLQMAEALMQMPAHDEAIASPDGMPNEHLVVQQLATLTQAVLGCERATIAAVDLETAAIRSVASVGLSDVERQEWHRISPHSHLKKLITKGALSRLRAGEAVMVDMADVSASGRLLFAVGHEFIVPIRLGEQLVGILSLGYDTLDRQCTPDEVDFAEAVGKLAALVLERDRLLHERARAEAQLLALLETNRLMNEFLGIASHELRTPLTVIRANAQLLNKTLGHLLDPANTTPLDQDMLRERVGGLTSRIDYQSHRQERLVNDLLDVSRIEAGRLELHVAATDLAAIVREGVEEQRLLNDQRVITLALPSGCDTVPIEADADRVSQVITNFLTNALKYSASEAPVSVSLELEGDMARVSVRDHGPGLSPETHAAIWERFYRVPDVEVRSGSGIGLGLGLYISRTIIERLGGVIGVESAPGHGSTFWFTLPVAHAEM